MRAHILVTPVSRRLFAGLDVGAWPNYSTSSRPTAVTRTSQWMRHITGRDEIARFHRWMLKFAPDSVIEFGGGCAADGRQYIERVWSGTFEGALRLPDGSSVQSTRAKISVSPVSLRAGTRRMASC